MKSKRYLFWFFLCFHSLFAQKFVGKWSGLLQVQGQGLHLIFTINNNDGNYKATLDSPDQGAIGIPVTTTIVHEEAITFEIPAGKLRYDGTLKNDSIIGTFKQNGFEFKLNLVKSSSVATELKRPQEPKQPFDYYVEEVMIQTKHKNTILSGTFTRPIKTGAYPTVILISGSGPQNRDEELFGHKPFLVLADYLTKNGIAVLRYDDRGVGKSTGDFKNATTLDFAEDVASAISYLKTRNDVNASKIGLIGHSEGGLIAPMVAATNKEIGFIVLLAGPALPGNKLLLLQKQKIETAMGVPSMEIAQGQKVFSDIYKIMAKNKGAEAIKTYLSSLKELPFSTDQINTIISQLDSPWMRFYINYDPSVALLKTKCALFALNGEKDLQVPCSENLNEMRTIMSKTKNKNVQFKSYPKLNHLFQTSNTGTINEYPLIEETIATQVLQDISTWIALQTK